MDPEEEHEDWHNQGELVKFMVLVGVMLLAVLFVAASRPLIFDWIVPAAFGWNRGMPGAAPDGSLPTMPVLFAEDGTTAVSPAAEEASPALELEEALVPVATVTALPEATATPQSYQVQRGDNLTAIARRFGVTVEALMAANSISNPNRIMPGEILIIPAD